MILGKPSLPGDYYETKNDLQIKKWKLEILLENICREQSVLDQDRFNFEVKRQEFVQLARVTSAETCIIYELCCVIVLTAIQTVAYFISKANIFLVGVIFLIVLLV